MIVDQPKFLGAPLSEYTISEELVWHWESKDGLDCVVIRDHIV